MLTDVAAFLDERGVRATIVDQEGAYLRPDAEFEWNGHAYNLEVESSTLYKDAGQFVRNVRKALADNRPCLVVVAKRELAARVSSIVRDALPRAVLWREFGIVWLKGSGDVSAFTDGHRPPWPFLVGRADQVPEGGEEDEAEDDDWEPVDEWKAGSPNDEDLAVTRRLASGLLEAGCERATARDFLERVPPEGGKELDARGLGMALSSLGVVGRRIRQDGRQVREYDLRPLRTAPSSTAATLIQQPAGAPNSTASPPRLGEPG